MKTMMMTQSTNQTAGEEQHDNNGNAYQANATMMMMNAKAGGNASALIVDTNPEGNNNVLEACEFICEKLKREDKEQVRCATTLASCILLHSSVELEKSHSFSIDGNLCVCKRFKRFVKK